MQFLLDFLRNFCFSYALTVISFIDGRECESPLRISRRKRATIYDLYTNRRIHFSLFCLQNFQCQAFNAFSFQQNELSIWMFEGVRRSTRALIFPDFTLALVDTLSIQNDRKPISSSYLLCLSE